MAKTLCEQEKNQLLIRCHKSKFCPLAQLRAALVEMCGDEPDLKESSYRAGEQILLIAGVISLCCLLYLVSALAEAFCCRRLRDKSSAGATKNTVALGSAVDPPTPDHESRWARTLSWKRRNREKEDNDSDGDRQHL